MLRSPHEHWYPWGGAFVAIAVGFVAAAFAAAAPPRVANAWGQWEAAVAYAAFILGAIALVGGVRAWRFPLLREPSVRLLTCEWETAYKFKRDDVEKLAKDKSEWGDQYCSVRAINADQHPTTIEEWGFSFLDANTKPTQLHIVSLTPDPGSPPLPHRLDAQSSSTWMMKSDHLSEEIQNHDGEFHGLVAYVRTGTNKMVYSDPIKFDSS